MIYRVIIQPNAAREIDDIVGYIAADSHANALRWFDGLMNRIRSLGRFPRRCPIAPENPYFREQIRHFVHGNYRIIFTIDVQTVRILHDRHAARRPLGQTDEPQAD